MPWSYNNETIVPGIFFPEFPLFIKNNVAEKEKESEILRCDLNVPGLGKDSL